MDEAIRNAPKQTLGTMYVRSVLYLTYDNAFEVFNHSGPGSNPLSSVAFHDIESSNGRNALFERIDEFDNLRLYRKTGLNLTQFLALPRHVVEYIIDKAEKEIIADQLAAEADDLEDQFHQKM